MNDEGVASVIRDVVTIPVLLPAAMAISMIVSNLSLVLAAVEIRPSLVGTPVAIDVAPLAESPT
tara:strand:- start:6 stop:197 length:192 start_codon:yes stop_codon:yes gene_type:complete